MLSLSYLVEYHPFPPFSSHPYFSSRTSDGPQASKGFEKKQFCAEQAGPPFLQHLLLNMDLSFFFWGLAFLSGTARMLNGSGLFG